VTRPSNGTEGQAWMAAWCETCAKDVDDNCPIVLAGLVGNDPPEWHPGPLWSPQTVMYCTEYDPRARADAEEGKWSHWCLDQVGVWLPTHTIQCSDCGAIR